MCSISRHDCRFGVLPNSKSHADVYAKCATKVVSITLFALQSVELIGTTALFFGVMGFVLLNFTIGLYFIPALTFLQPPRDRISLYSLTVRQPLATMHANYARQDTLENGKKREILKEFMMREFSLEKLNALTQIELFRAMPAEKLPQQAEKIAATFIREDAPQQVNISHAQREQQLEAVEQLKEKGVEDLEDVRGTFDPLARVLLNIMHGMLLLLAISECIDLF